MQPILCEKMSVTKGGEQMDLKVDLVEQRVRAIAREIAARGGSRNQFDYALRHLTRFLSHHGTANQFAQAYLRQARAIFHQQEAMTKAA